MSNHEKENTWKKLQGNRHYKKLQVDDTTILVVAPRGHDEVVVPLFCPMCEYTIKTQEDTEAYHAKGMCKNCKSFWATKNFDIDTDIPDWHEYLDDMILNYKFILNIK